MNVLIDGVTPKVCSLKEVLRAFLDFRREVLLRRSRHRMEKIDHRLEVLEGFIVAFLNLDRVIDIIRYDDDPKAALMREDWAQGLMCARWTRSDYVPPAPGEGELTEVQAEAILNMRLRSLAPAGRDGAAARARRADGRTRRARGSAGQRRAAMGDASPTSCARPKSTSARTTRAARAAPHSPRRARSKTCRSRR